MNSEEIKEIGQFFLNIQNNNENKSNSVVDYKLVSEEITEKIHRSEEGTDTRIFNLDEEIKKLKLELHKVECKLLPAPDEYLLDKVKELGAKVGKFGNQVGGYGGLISNLQKRDGERTAELNKIRKDYRELQEEMWERFKLAEAWIETKDSAEKERIRLEILDNGHTDKKIKLSSSLDTVENTPNATCVTPKQYSVQKTAEEAFPNLKNKWLNWETSQSIAWSKIPISKLNNVSVRAHNALIVGGFLHIGSLLTKSPYDLIKVKNFGRKCLREVMNALEEKNLLLNMQKFAEQKEERNSRENTQRGNLWGFKT